MTLAIGLFLALTLCGASALTAGAVLVYRFATLEPPPGDSTWSALTREHRPLLVTGALATLAYAALWLARWAT